MSTPTRQYRAVIRRDVISRGGAAERLRKRLRADLRDGRLARCAGCGGEFLPSLVDIDHVTPIYQGGEDTDDNVQVLCRDICHAVKTADDMGYAPF